MFTAGQAPVTFRCRPRWWSIFPFSAPSARRWPALLPSLSAFPRLRGVWGGAFLRSRPLPLFAAFSAARSLRFCSCCPRAAAGGAFCLFLLFHPAGSASRVLPLSCSSFRRSAAHSRPFVFLLPSGSSHAAAPWAALRLCSCPRAAAGGASSRSFPFLGSFPSCGPTGRLWPFFPPWLFLFFCSSLCCPPAARTFLSPSSFLRRMAALPVLPLFSFFCPVLRSLYWARPIFMYVFDFLFLFIVLGSSIGRYRRMEDYRLRRNTAQPVWMGDAGCAVNIILERKLVKKERVGKRTDLAEGIREKRGTRGEGGPREGCGKHYFNGLPWCVGCRGGLWRKSGVP